MKVAGRVVRPVELGRAAWGAALLLAPRQVMNVLPHVRTDHKSVVIARVLGARQLAQAALSGIDPSPEVLAMGVWVDIAHASTAFALAAVDHDRAGAGLADGLIASTWAAVGWRDLGSGDDGSADSQRRRDRLADFVLGVVPGGAVLRRRART